MDVGWSKVVYTAIYTAPAAAKNSMGFSGDSMKLLMLTVANEVWVQGDDGQLVELTNIIRELQSTLRRIKDDAELLAARIGDPGSPITNGLRSIATTCKIKLNTPPTL